MDEASENCAGCNEPVRWNEVRCAKCGRDLGFPNVRLAERHRVALEQRLATATRQAGPRRIWAARAVDTHAVVAMPPDVALKLQDEGSLYASYQGLIAGEVRRPAHPDSDRIRGGIEEHLYGSHARGNLRYAALSTDGSGLHAYGVIGAVLEDNAIGHRATVLEGNSWDVVGQLQHVAPLPQGCVATWRDRADLVAAVAGPRLKRASPTPAEAAAAILRPSDKRGQDRFFEVHVWGPFNRNAIANWRLLRPAALHEQEVVDLVRGKVRASKSVWIAS